MTTSLHDRLQLIENPESRVACIILIDASNSMTGEPIAEVNRGLVQFSQQIEADELTSMRADVAVIAFNHEHEVVRQFGQHVDFSRSAIETGGGTRLAPPLNTALDMIEARKAQYREARIPYYRPIIMLLTDGKPEHDEPTDLKLVADRIKAAQRSKGLTFFPIGTQSADMNVLSSLTSFQPKTLRGTNFVALFEWLSNSITAISQSQMGDDVPLPDTDGWSIY